jgi:hypothetical protein
MKGGVVACKGHKLEGGDGSKRLAPRGRRAAFGSLIHQVAFIFNHFGDLFWNFLEGFQW